MGRVMVTLYEHGLEDFELIKLANGLVKSSLQFDNETLLDTLTWALESNQDAACLAQQLYAEKMGWA